MTPSRGPVSCRPMRARSEGRTVGGEASHRVLETLWRHKITAILRCPNARLAADAMEAAVRGGLRCIEFTLTTPSAFRLIEEFAGRDGLDEVHGDTTLTVGAGTVLRPDEARRAVDAGAKFLVSPVMDPEIIATAARLGVPVIPGVNTPSEMMQAHRLGAQLLKLFPVPAGGPQWLRSVLAPLPFLRVVPTSGVDNDNLAEWIDAGAWSVGLVRSLFVPADLGKADFEAVHKRAAAAVEIAAAIHRGEAPGLDGSADPMLTPRA